MIKIQDDILSYREMCDNENVQTLQRGMNFRMNPSYSVILMSQRTNAPYKDRIYEDGITIEYEGHDVAKKVGKSDPKTVDQKEFLPSGKLTQNGLFIKAVRDFKEGKFVPETIKVYEKIVDGVWSLKGFFKLIDYKMVENNDRMVFRFILKLTKSPSLINSKITELPHNRVIPSEVKKEVWKRDGGRCVLCGEIRNLHFDHELPFSKGGASVTAKNIRLLCMKHNLQKSNKIE